MATSMEVHPGKLGDKAHFRPRYGNYIGGKWVEPASGKYFENVTPITGRTFCEIPRSNAQDIER
jgi:aldehyde dehydrogenase